MALNLYRRHKGSCKLHPPGSFNGEFEERKKGWQKCACPITVSGIFPDGEFRRKSTGEWEWDRARAVKEAWEKGELPPPPAKKPIAAPGSVPVEEATRLFIEDHKTFGSAKGTITRYAWLTRQIENYSKQHGVACVDEWTKTMVREFAASWEHGPRSTKKTLSQLKSFFSFCQESEWIDQNPAAIRRHRNRATESGGEEQRLPYTDAEIARMYDACLKYEIGRKWNGEDLADFISLAIYTGLRRSDLASFNAERLNPETGEVRLRTTKYGTQVCTWIPEWLVQRIQHRAVLFGPYIFGERRTTDPAVLGLTWYTRLVTLWGLCGPWKQKPNLHRFRHTFIRIMLQNGHPPALVADLVGDNEATIRRHYSAWVSERQAYVTNALRGSFANVPRPQFQESGRLIAFDQTRRSA